MLPTSPHVFHIDDQCIDAIIRPVFAAFNRTPYYPLYALPDCHGTGVYALYMTSTHGTAYEAALPPMYPVYIGKSSPSSRTQPDRAGKSLIQRLNKHRKSIAQAENLSEEHFVCRFIILEGRSADLVSTIESYLINTYRPLWNTTLSGFGINAPGAGRSRQAPSAWDTLHPGRSYAQTLCGDARDRDHLLDEIGHYQPAAVDHGVVIT